MNVPPAERPPFRRTADGRFEYRHRQSLTRRDGYVEEWEPASTHVAKNMEIPAAMLRGLREHGYDGGRSVLDLLLADGWMPPGVAGALASGYIEVTRPDDPLIGQSEFVPADDRGET